MNPRDPRARRRHLAPAASPAEAIAWSPPASADTAAGLRPGTPDGDAPGTVAVHRPEGPALTPPRTPTLLEGAVRAELLADDWRAGIRAQVDEAAAHLDTYRDPAEEEDATARNDAGRDLAEERWQRAEAEAEAATEQGDDPAEEDAPDPVIEAVRRERAEVEAIKSWAPPTEGPHAVGSAGDAEEPEGEEWSDEAGEPDLTSLPAGPESSAMIARGIDGARVMDWASKHDERSLQFLVRDQLRVPVPVQDRVWPHGPILDQGTTPPLTPHDASGCTGFATAAALNALGLDLTRDEAFELYLGAQKRDHVPGEEYPGTSVLAVMQEAKARGLIGAYLWAPGTRDIAQALLNDNAGGARFGPVVLGIPWPSGMAVDGDAVLTVEGDRGGLGHSIAAIGIVRARAGRPGPWFVLQQSSGPAVGDGGLLYLHHTDLGLLLRGVGEAAVPVIPA